MKRIWERLQNSRMEGQKWDATSRSAGAAARVLGAHLRFAPAKPLRVQGRTMKPLSSKQSAAIGTSPGVHRPFFP